VATSYDAFVPWVLVNAPGCPEISAVQALKDATIQFCEQTLIHQVDHDPISSIANIADYDLESPVSGTRVHKIMRAWYEGNILMPVAPDEVSEPTVYNQNIGGYQKRTGTPTGFIHKDHASLSLIPVPDVSRANSVTLRVALAPLRSASTVADFLYENWGEFISNGATARVMAMPNKAFHNPSAAAYHQTRYQIGINQARQQANHGYNRSNLQVKFRRV